MGHEFVLYAEDSDDIRLAIWCQAGRTEKIVQFFWGNRRPAVEDDAFEVKQSDGTVHSTGHSVRVRYGSKAAQSQTWQLVHPEVSSRNFSWPSAYLGDDAGYIHRYQQVDTLTIWTDTESDTIRAEFDLRRLDKALARLNQYCN